LRGVSNLNSPSPTHIPTSNVIPAKAGIPPPHIPTSNVIPAKAGIPPPHIPFMWRISCIALLIIITAIAARNSEITLLAARMPLTPIALVRYQL